MYCGSCLRDNALAAELRARPRRHAAAGLHADPHRRDERQRRPASSSAASACTSSSTSALFRHTPALLDRLWDSPRDDPAGLRELDPGGPPRLGEMTVSMLRGEEGYSARRSEAHALAGRQPPPDVVTLPNSLLIGLAKPIRARARPASAARCRARTCSSTVEGPGIAPRPGAGRANGACRRLHSRPANTAALHGRLSAASRATHDCARSHRVHLAPSALRAGLQPAPAPFAVHHRISSRASRPRRALHLPRRTRNRELRTRCRRTGRASVARAGYLAPEHKHYLERHRRRQRQRRSRRRVPRYRGELDRAGRCDSCRARRVLRAGAYDGAERASESLRRWRRSAGRRSRATARSPRSVQKTGGGMLVEAGRCARDREGIWQLSQDPAAPVELGRHAAGEVRATTA